VEGKKQSPYTCLDKLGYIDTFLKCVTAEETVQYFGISQDEAVARVLESGEELRYEVANIALEQEMTDNESARVDRLGRYAFDWQYMGSCKQTRYQI